MPSMSEERDKMVLFDLVRQGSNVDEIERRLVEKEDLGGKAMIEGRRARRRRRVDARDQNGDTLLHVACRHQHVRVVDILLTEGAALSIRNNSGEWIGDRIWRKREDATSSTESFRNAQIRELLVEGWQHRLLSTIRRSEKIAVSTLSNILEYGDMMPLASIGVEGAATILGAAAKYASMDALRCVLETIGGTENVSMPSLPTILNHRVKVTGFYAVDHAVVGNRPHVVRLLISHGARPDVTLRQSHLTFTPSRSMIRSLRETERMNRKNERKNRNITSEKKKKGHEKDGSGGSRSSDSGATAAERRGPRTYPVKSSHIRLHEMPTAERLFDYAATYRISGDLSKLTNVDVTWRCPSRDHDEFPLPNKYNSIFWGWPFLSEAWCASRSRASSRLSSLRVISVFLQSTLDLPSTSLKDGRIVEVTSESSEIGLCVGDLIIRIGGVDVGRDSRVDDRIRGLLNRTCRPLHVEVIRRTRRRSVQALASSSSAPTSSPLSTSSAPSFALFSSVLHQASNKPNIYFTSLTFPCEDGRGVDKEQSNSKTSSSIAVCLFSHWPFLQMQERLLLEFFRHAVVTKSVLDGPSLMTAASRFLRDIVTSVPLPAPGSSSVAISYRSNIIAMFRRPRSHALPNVESFMFDMLFSYFSVNTILRMIGYLITSRSLLVVSDKIDLLTPISEAIFALCFPMRLDHIFIPVLPPSKQYAGYLRAPVPLFAGLHASAIDLVFSERSSVNVVIANIDTGGLIPPIGNKIMSAHLPEDVVRITEREIRRHIQPVETEGSADDGDKVFNRCPVVVDAPFVRTACVRMMCALLDGFSAKVLDLSVNGTDVLVGGTDEDVRLYNRIKSDAFYEQLFQCQTWVNFVKEYLHHIQVSTSRQAQLDVFERYRSIWTTPEENCGRLPVVLFPHRDRSAEEIRPIVITVRRDDDNIDEGLCTGRSNARTSEKRPTKSAQDRTHHKPEPISTSPDRERKTEKNDSSSSVPSSPCNDAARKLAEVRLKLKKLREKIKQQERELNEAASP